MSFQDPARMGDGGRATISPTPAPRRDDSQGSPTALEAASTLEANAIVRLLFGLHLPDNVRGFDLDRGFIFDDGTAMSVIGNELREATKEVRIVKRYLDGLTLLTKNLVSNNNGDIELVDLFGENLVRNFDVIDTLGGDNLKDPIKFSSEQYNQILLGTNPDLKIKGKNGNPDLKVEGNIMDSLKNMLDTLNTTLKESDSPQKQAKITNLYKQASFFHKAINHPLLMPSRQAGESDQEYTLQKVRVMKTIYDFHFARTELYDGTISFIGTTGQFDKATEDKERTDAYNELTARTRDWLLFYRETKGSLDNYLTSTLSDEEGKTTYVTLMISALTQLSITNEKDLKFIRTGYDASNGVESALMGVRRRIKDLIRDIDKRLELGNQAWRGTLSGKSKGNARKELKEEGDARAWGGDIAALKAMVAAATTFSAAEYMGGVFNLMLKGAAQFFIGTRQLDFQFATEARNLSAELDDTQQRLEDVKVEAQTAREDANVQRTHVVRLEGHLRTLSAERKQMIQQLEALQSMAQENADLKAQLDQTISGARAAIAKENALRTENKKEFASAISAAEENEAKAKATAMEAKIRLMAADQARRQLQAKVAELKAQQQRDIQKNYIGASMSNLIRAQGDTISGVERQFERSKSAFRKMKGRKTVKESQEERVKKQLALRKRRAPVKLDIKRVQLELDEAKKALNDLKDSDDAAKKAELQTKVNTLTARVTELEAKLSQIKAPIGDALTPICAHCGVTEKLQLCVGCETVHYCSEDCQNDHWVEHESECLSVASAD